MSGDNTYRATITKIGSDGIYVIVPKLGRGVEYGPCQRLAAVTDVQGGDYAHSHGTVAQYQPQQQVLVTTINGIPDDLVVLGALA